MDNGSSDSSSTSSDVTVVLDDEVKGHQTEYVPDQNGGEKGLQNTSSTIEADLWQMTFALSVSILDRPVGCAENEGVPDSGISSRNSSPSINNTKTEKKKLVNMLAARQSRQKKKDYISKLEAAFQIVRSQHKELVNEVIHFKERCQYYSHNFSPVHVVFGRASTSGMQYSAHNSFAPRPSTATTKSRRTAVPNLSKKKPNVAAQKSRQKKRDYIRHLEESFEILRQQHKELAEELMKLKELCRTDQVPL